MRTKTTAYSPYSVPFEDIATMPYSSLVAKYGRPNNRPKFCSYENQLISIINMKAARVLMEKAQDRQLFEGLEQSKIGRE